MKRTDFAALLFFSAVFLNGCMPSALLPVMTAGSVYQGYESIAALKNVKDKKPVFKKYRNAFVLVDVQPKTRDSVKMNAAMERAYSRTISEMAREMGMDLVCRPYDTSDFSDKPDALIIQVEEVKSSLLGKLASGGKMKISVKFIDKKSARCLDEENYNVSKNYHDVLGVISFSSMLKMNGDNTTNSAIFKNIMENREKYPIVTARERELLLNV